jgi:hypothetical protein
MGKGLLIALAIILLASLVLAPLITYSYLTCSYNSVIDAHKNNEKDLLRLIDSLAAQNKELTEEKSQLTNITQPYLISRLGWYLHKSDDPVASSKNTFTIYGRVYNIGILPANDTELEVKFYGRNETLLQTSTILLGIVPSIVNSTTPFDMPFDVGKRDIGCLVADSVMDVEISLHY